MAEEKKHRISKVALVLLIVGFSLGIAFFFTDIIPLFYISLIFLALSGVCSILHRKLHKSSLGVEESKNNG